MRDGDRKDVARELAPEFDGGDAELVLPNEIERIAQNIKAITY